MSRDFSRAARVLALLFFLWVLSANGVKTISAAALVYSIFLILNLFYAFGKQLPYKQLILALMGIQLIIAPFLEYYYFKSEVYGVMRVDESIYFSYVFPAVVAFNLGLTLFHPRQTLEKEIAFYLEKYPLKQADFIGWTLIVLGFLSQTIGGLITIPACLGFIVTIMTFLRFIGLFYLWFSNGSYIKLAFVIVFIPFVVQIIQNSIFIDLIVISALFTSAFLMKREFSKRWLYLGAAVAFSFLVILQSIKHSYRAIIWKTDYEGSEIALFSNMMIEQISNIAELDLKIIGKEVNRRINQGWILGDVLNNTPEEGTLSEVKYFRNELIGILLPRFLFPDKPVVGDKEKFAAFTGWRLGGSTTMNVGILGDGYGNFGYYGGILFCFGFGAALGLIFSIFYSAAKSRPSVLFWGVLLFFYAMRAGNDFYIIGNWLFKSGIFILFYFSIFENKKQIVIRSYKKKSLSVHG